MTLKNTTTMELLRDLRSWNNSDLRNIDEISPNREMLLARRRVILELMRRQHARELLSKAGAS